MTNDRVLHTGVCFYSVYDMLGLLISPAQHEDTHQPFSCIQDFVASF